MERLEKDSFPNRSNDSERRSEENLETGTKRNEENSLSLTTSYYPEQSLMPQVSLGMEHRIVLSDRQKLLLLQERQKVIQQGIDTIQSHFLQIGKALAEIKKFRLYKADPLYKTWEDYLNHRIKTKLHQSTITDYIGIFVMRTENKDFMSESELLSLGYKKTKLLKSKLNLIKKEKDSIKQKDLIDRFKTFYRQSFQEFRDLPYTTYERALELRLHLNGPVDLEKEKSEEKEESPEQKSQWIEKSTPFFQFRLDKTQKTITIQAKSKVSMAKLEEFFEKVVRNG